MVWLNGFIGLSNRFWDLLFIIAKRTGRICYRCVNSRTTTWSRHQHVKLLSSWTRAFIRSLFLNLFSLLLLSQKQMAVCILLRVRTGSRSNRKLWLLLRIASGQRWISRSSMRTNRGRTLLLRKGRWCLSTEIFCRKRFLETSHVRSWHRDDWVHLRSWRFRTWQLCECNCRDLAKLTHYLMWRSFNIFMKMYPWGEHQKSPQPQFWIWMARRDTSSKRRCQTSVQRKSTIFGQVDWLRWAYLGAKSQRAWWVWYTDCSTTKISRGQRKAGIMWQLHS